jgi:hypothetical protein
MSENNFLAEDPIDDAADSAEDPIDTKFLRAKLPYL